MAPLGQNNRSYFTTKILTQHLHPPHPTTDTSSRTTSLHLDHITLPRASRPQHLIHTRDSRTSATSLPLGAHSPHTLFRELPHHLFPQLSPRIPPPSPTPRDSNLHPHSLPAVPTLPHPPRLEPVSPLLAR